MAASVWIISHRVGNLVMNCNGPKAKFVWEVYEPDTASTTVVESQCFMAPACASAFQR